MAQVNPNDVAKAGIANIQSAINRLTAQQQQPGADIPGIDAQINALQASQQGLRNQALRTIVDSDANKQAIAAMNAAAGNLTTEAAKIKDLATALTGVAKVATATASLITAVAPFVV